MTSKMLLRSLIFWIVLFGVSIFVWQTFFSPPPPEIKGYTEFLQNIETGKVVSVEVNSEKTEALFSMKDAKGSEIKCKVVLLDSDYVALARKYHVEVKGTEAHTSVFAVISSLIPLLLLGVMCYFIFSMNQARKIGARKFDPVQTKVKVTFADIAGCDEAKADLRQTVEFLKNPEKFTRLGGEAPKGTLLVGAPGVGKTLLAKAVAGEASCPFIELSASDFIEMFVGVGASRVRDLFATAHKIAPCVVFIDEFDAIGTRSSGATFGGHSESDQTINAFLREMDGFGSTEGVIFLAATNRPEKLDKALLRPGRFDRRVVVPLPDVKGREMILRIHARNKPLTEDVDLRKLAASLPGASGAELKNVLNEAALRAGELDKSVIDVEIIDYAKNRVNMGAERKSLIMSDEEKKNTAYHEGGHALVGALTPGSDPLDHVTIIPREHSLGHTMFIPDEKNEHSQSKKYLNTLLAWMMGGRIGEEILNGPDGVTTGAGTDSEKATGIIWDMVCRGGMSELGLITFADTEQNPYLGGSRQLRNCSEATRAKIDAEIIRIFNERYEYAKELLTRHQDALHAIAQALLERETITGDEVKEIIAQNPPSR